MNCNMFSRSLTDVFFCFPRLLTYFDLRVSDRRRVNLWFTSLRPHIGSSLTLLNYGFSRVNYSRLPRWLPYTFTLPCSFYSALLNMIVCVCVCVHVVGWALQGGRGQHLNLRLLWGKSLPGFTSRDAVTHTHKYIYRSICMFALWSIKLLLCMQI